MNVSFRMMHLMQSLKYIRDLEQAADHMAANALYQIEVNHVSKVVFTPEMVSDLLS